MKPSLNTNQPDHPQTPPNQAKLSDRTKTSSRNKLRLDRSKQGSVTKKNEREKKKEKERNINLKLGEKLKTWLKMEDKEDKTVLEITKNKDKTEEKKTVNNLIGMFEKQQKSVLQKLNGQSEPTVRLSEVFTTNSNIQQESRYADGVNMGLKNIMMADNSTQENHGS